MHRRPILAVFSMQIRLMRWEPTIPRAGPCLAVEQVHPSGCHRAPIVDVELVLSCEHASAAVPEGLEPTIPWDVLQSHRGWDPGAADVALALGAAFGVTPILGRVTRLLVDLNRSADNPRATSSVARTLAAEAREQLHREHHATHWRAVEQAIACRTCVLHVSVHSFTPTLRGKARAMDIGLLYDPRRASELRVACRWQSLLRGEGLHVARNTPYRGVSDGITRGMRRRFGVERYAGLELELNQRLLSQGTFGQPLISAIRRTLSAILESEMHPCGGSQAP